MNLEFEEILDRCIYLIKTGQDTVEGCLEKNAQVRQELEPLLQTVALLQSVPSVLPSQAFKAQALKRLERAVEEKRLASKVGWRKSLSRRAIVVFAAVFLLGGSVALASTRSLPGSILYPVKLGLERAQLILTPSPSKKARLNLEFSRRRMIEVRQLIERQRGKNLSTPLELMSHQLKQAQKMEKKVQAKDKEEVLKNILKATERQQAVLKEISKKAPEEAKEALSRALEVSRRGHEQAESALKKEKIFEKPEIKKPERREKPGELVPRQPGGQRPEPGRNLK